MVDELLHFSRTPREGEVEGAKLDGTIRGRAPKPMEPFEKPRLHTPATAKDVAAAIRRVWGASYMKGPASQDAVCVLLGQWGVETFKGTDGQACHNWNLAGIKTARPESEWHYRMETPDDMPEKQAEAYVAAQKRLRPGNPLAFFDTDKNLAGAGKLRVWQIACFRSSESLESGAKLFIGTVAHFAAALPFMHAGQPEAYANALSDQVMGANKGWFNAPSSAYQTGMRVRFDKYKAAGI